MISKYLDLNYGFMVFLGFDCCVLKFVLCQFGVGIKLNLCWNNTTNIHISVCILKNRYCY